MYPNNVSFILCDLDNKNENSRDTVDVIFKTFDRYCFIKFFARHFWGKIPNCYYLVLVNVIECFFSHHKLLHEIHSSTSKSHDYIHICSHYQKVTSINEKNALKITFALHLPLSVLAWLHPFVIRS